MIRIALAGAGGRMGAAVAQMLEEEPDLELVHAAERPGHPRVGSLLAGCAITDSLPREREAADVLLDFTSAAAFSEVLATVQRLGMPLVSGTTGLDQSQRELLAAAAREIPVLHANNMSLGIAAMRALLRLTTAMLPGYDVEVLEMHHRRKRDAPSGTALSLAEAICESRADLELVHGRSGDWGPRKSSELGIHALRGGDAVGEHEVIFAGPGERVTLRHQADHRGAFAAGAVSACRFILGKAAGLYGMEHVLGMASKASRETED